MAHTPIPNLQAKKGCTRRGVHPLFLILTNNLDITSCHPFLVVQQAWQVHSPQVYR